MTHTVKNPPAGDQGLIPGLGKASGEGNGYPPEFLFGEFHGQRSLAGYRPWGHKESDAAELLSLSKPLATTFSTFCFCEFDYKRSHVSGITQYSYT